MEAFYVCIIFLGILLVLVSLFFIIMDRANGKDFFKEFDRKKEEMFSLIQDSEEMVEELNRMSDYVVSMISEKNQEFFNKFSASNNQTEAKAAEEQISQLPVEEKTKEAEPQSTQVSQDIQEKQEEVINTARSGLVLNEKRREVMKMIEQGLSNDEIAEKMKMGKGEIGLIRGLSRQ